MPEEKVSIFEATQDQGTSNAGARETPEQNANSEYAQLVGEGKKFKDANSLAKSKLESDRFVQRLQEENAEMRREIEARANSEEIARKLAESRGADKPPAVDTTPIDNDLLDRAINDKLSEREKQQAFKNNYNEAQEFIIEKTGSPEAAMKLITDKAAALGVQKNWLQDMAMRTPKALYALLGLVDQPSAPSKTGVSGDVNTEAQRIVNRNPRSAEGSKAYFEDIRRTNPNKYWSAEVQSQIFKAAKEGKYK
jgi:hypothetical protein